MADKNFPHFDLIQLPSPPTNYMIDGKPDSEYLKHTVSELRAFLQYHAFGFDYSINKPRAKGEYVSLLKKLHYYKPSITCQKAEGPGIVSPLLCHGDVGPGTLEPSIRQQYSVPLWSLPEKDALKHIQPHEWLKHRKPPRPNAQDPTTNITGRPRLVKLVPTPPIGSDLDDNATAMLEGNLPTPEPTIQGNLKPSLQNSPPTPPLSQPHDSLEDPPIPIVGEFTPINPWARAIPGLGNLTPISSSHSPQPSSNVRHASTGLSTNSNTSFAPNGVAGSSVDNPPLSPPSDDFAPSRRDHSTLELSSFPPEPPSDPEFNLEAPATPESKRSELRRDIIKAAERLVYNYVYHGLLRHPEAPVDPQPSKETASTSDDLRKAVPAALRANSNVKVKGDPYVDKYYGLANDARTQSLLEKNNRLSVTQNTTLGELCQNSVRDPPATQATSSSSTPMTGNSSITNNPDVQTTSLPATNSSIKASIPNQSKQKDATEHGVSLEGGKRSIMSVSSSSSSSSTYEAHNYRFYGRGPVFSHNSCYLDTTITASLLLNAGMMVADRAEDHEGWYDKLDRIQKEFVDTLNAPWEFDSQRGSIDRRNILREAYRRDKNANLEPGDPGFLTSDGRASVTEVWDRLLGPFGQFTFTGVTRTTPCQCRGARGPSYSSKRLHHSVTPDYEPQDSNGVDIQTLLQRAFTRHRPCRFCKQLTRSIDEIVTNKDLPLRLVAQLQPRTRVTGHTSENIGIQYNRKEGLDDPDRLEEATYRYLGGIYFTPKSAHFVVAWMPPCTSPTHHASPCASDEEANSILLYDSMLLAGSIIGVPVPTERAQTGEKVPEKFMQGTPPILFYERVLDPTSEVLDELERVVKRMGGKKRRREVEEGEDRMEAGSLKKIKLKLTKADPSASAKVSPKRPEKERREDKDNEVAPRTPSPTRKKRQRVEEHNTEEAASKKPKLEPISKAPS